MSTLKETIVSMLTENTGRSILDSGGIYGRNFERNKGKDVAYYESTPQATLEISKYGDNWEALPTVSIFHLLTQTLGLDSYCKEFNTLEVGNHNGDYYGTDWNQCEWLKENEFEGVGEGFNTYNWASNHSQILQGQELNRDGETYVLLQIHGGCDARGGYTDAKLFKVSSNEIYSILNTDCGFSAELPNGEFIKLDFFGQDVINNEGGCADDDYINQFCEAIGEGVHSGDIFAYC